MFEQKPQRFTVTQEHITLLQALNVPRKRLSDTHHDDLCFADWKRPFGNSDIVCDAIRLIFGEHAVDEEGCYDEDHADHVLGLISDMRTVFQILVDNLSIQVGTYGRTSDRYEIHFTHWRLVT